MKRAARVGEIEAAAGEKVSGFLDVSGTNVRMPLTLVNGASEGPTLLIAAGIHGGEYPSIEATSRLSVEVQPSDVSGQAILVPLVNPEAFHARRQYVLPADGKNVNRRFPGRALDAGGGGSERPRRRAVP